MVIFIIIFIRQSNSRRMHCGSVDILKNDVLFNDWVLKIKFIELYGLFAHILLD